MPLSRYFVTSTASSNEVGPLEGMNIYSYGHSWSAGTAYNTAPGTAGGQWVYRLAARKRATVVQRAIEGRWMVDVNPCVMRDFLTGSLSWQPNSRGAIVICCTQNEAGAAGTDAAFIRGYGQGIRAILAASRAMVRAPAIGGGWVVSSGWGASSTATAYGSNRLETTTTGSYAEVKATGTDVDILLNLKAAGSGNYTIAVDGSTVKTVDLTATVGFDNTTSAIRVSGMSSGTHTIRITLTSGSYLGVEALLIPSPTPPPVVFLGEGKITSEPVGTNVQNSWLPAMAAAVADYPHAVYVSGNDGWDTATMLDAGGGHPNDKGAGFLATKVLDAFDAKYDWTNGLNFQGALPTYLAPTIASTPSGGRNPILSGVAISADDVTRSNSTTLGSTPTGGFAWTKVNPGTPTLDWQIIGNEFAIIPGNQTCILYHDAGRADGIVSAKVKSGFSAALVFRYTDSSNYWKVWAPSGSTYRLQKVVSGVTSDVVVSSVGVITGDKVAVTLSGTSILATVNGVEVGRTTDSTGSTATKHGFESAGTSASQFDDFLFATPATYAAPVSTVLNLWSWYKADALTGLSNNDPVGTWVDSSGAGKSASAGGGDRPTYKTSQVNSLPALLFDGTNDTLAASEIVPGSYTVFAVIKAGVNGGALFGSNVANGTPQINITGGAGNQKIQLIKSFTSVIGTGAGSLSTSAFTVICATFASGSAWATYINGAADSSGSTGTTMVTTASTNQLIGRRDSVEPLDGTLAELIVYSGVLNGTDRSAVTAYLGTKYGITVV